MYSPEVLGHNRKVVFERSKEEGTEKIKRGGLYFKLEWTRIGISATKLE